MNSSVEENPPLRERFAEVFARLPEPAIEQFYAQYQLWLLRRRVPLLQKQIEAIDEHLAENQLVMQSLQPSAVALAVLARLQANGVSDIELLDLLLSRGEDWLDRMVQRLDYCEQVRDFIQGDYTQWCYRSLDGAYDWIDTLLGSADGDEESRQALLGESEATEELLLRKLRLDDEDEMLEATFRPPVESSPEDDEAAGPTVQSVPAEPAGQLPLAEASAEGSTLSAQPPELVDWADLDASGERPAPWYGVGLAVDGLPDPGAPAAISEGDSLLPKEGELRSGTDIPDAVEQARPVEVESNPQDEGSLSTADIGQEESAACPPGEAEESAQADETAESALVSLVESAIQESTEVANPVLPSIAESRTEPSEPVCDRGGEPDGDWHREKEMLAETLPEAEINQEEGTELPQVHGDVLLCGEVREPVEREEVAGVQEPLSIGQADGRANDDLADLQEEQRPWYEYLDLHQPTSPAQPAVGERVEPEAPALVALDRPQQADAWNLAARGEQQAEEATQPMMLRDVQRARERGDASRPTLLADSVSGRVHLSTDDGQLPEAPAARSVRETQGEVLSLPVPEASLPEEREHEEAEESVPPRHGQAALSWPQAERAPQKQSFWQRLFDWLQGKRAQL